MVISGVKTDKALLKGSLSISQVISGEISTKGKLDASIKLGSISTKHLVTNISETNGVITINKGDGTTKDIKLVKTVNNQNPGDDGNVSIDRLSNEDILKIFKMGGNN